MSQLDEVERLVKLRLAELRRAAGPGREDEVPSIPRAKFEGLYDVLGVIDYVRSHVADHDPLPEPEPMNGLFRTGQVAAIFDVTPRTITNWVDSGRLPAVRTPGGHLRFSGAEINKLLGISSNGQAS